MTLKERMHDSMIVGVVADTLRKQFKILSGTADYSIYTFLGGESAYLKPSEYKRLRRGVRWILSRAGFDGKAVLTDAILKGILRDNLKIAVREEDK